MASLFARFAQAAPVVETKEAGFRLIATLDSGVAANPRWIMAVVGVFALQFSLIFSHRPWLDEWQALQLALQSPTIPDLLTNLRYEGHPPLWYLILRSVGGWANPFLVLPIVAASLAAVAQSLVLFASPFSRAERLLLALGCFMMFEFLTISRSMTLGVTLLIAAMTLWRSRWAWLAIALLPMCDFLFGVLSGVLLLLQLRDGGAWWPGMIAWLTIAGLAGWTVRPAPDMIQALELTGPWTDAAYYLLRIGVLLVPLQWGEWLPGWNGPPPLGLGGLMGIAFLAFAYHELRPDGLQRLLFFGFVGLTFVFSVAVYPLHARHLMLVALLLILMVWRRAAGGTRASPLFRLWLLTGAACGLIVAATNFLMPFDTAHVAAREIAARGLLDKHWLVYPDSRGQGVAALAGMEFERTERRCMQSFIRWDYQTTLRTPAKLTDYLRREIAVRGRFYMLSDMPMGSIPRDVLHLIVHVPAGYDQQDYYLYVVGPQHSDAALHLPPCVPERRPITAART